MLLVGAVPVLAKRVEVDPSVALYVRTVEGEAVRGWLVAYDEVGIELRVGEGEQTRQVAWSRLEPARVYQLHEKLLPATDAEAWHALAGMLAEREDAERWRRRAEARAEWIERHHGAGDGASRDPARGESTGVATGQGAGDDDEPAGDAVRDATDAVAEQGPVQVGQAQHEFWGELSDEVMAKSVEALKGVGREAQRRLDKPLDLYETRYFLFYSDLDRDEAMRWATLLDEMYVRLAKLFALDPKVNIFRGKGLIFVFQRPEDYARFQVLVHGTDPSGSAGMAHTFGNGFVHVAFYRQPHDMSFATVLVHETVHGFLHRYRGPAPIPTWANEGLANYIAERLVRRATLIEQFDHLAMRQLRREPSLAGFFDAPRLAGWQYGVATRVTELMIQQNRRGYVAFINGIKDGMPWRESLEQHYGAGVDRIVRAYGHAIGIPELTP